MFPQEHSNNFDTCELLTNNGEYEFLSSCGHLLIEDIDTGPQQIDESKIFTNEDKIDYWWNQSATNNSSEEHNDAMTLAFKDDFTDCYLSKNDSASTANTDLFPNCNQISKSSSQPVDQLDPNVTNCANTEQTNNGLESLFDDLIHLEEELEIGKILKGLLEKEENIFPHSYKQYSKSSLYSESENLSMLLNMSPSTSVCNARSHVPTFFEMDSPLSPAQKFTSTLNQSRSILKTQTILNENCPSAESSKNQEILNNIIENEKILEDKMQRLGEQLVQLAKDGKLFNTNTSSRLAERSIPSMNMDEYMENKRSERSLKRNKRQTDTQIGRLQRRRKETQNRQQENPPTQSHLSDHCYYLTRNVMHRLNDIKDDVESDEEEETQTTNMLHLNSAYKRIDNQRKLEIPIKSTFVNKSSSIFPSSNPSTSASAFSSDWKNMRINPEPVVRRSRGRPRGSTNAAKRKRLAEQENAMNELLARRMNIISQDEGTSTSNRNSKSVLRKGRPKRQLTSEEKENKRLMHNMRERQRRKEMQEHLMKLRDTLPVEIKRKKMSTAALLKETKRAMSSWNYEVTYKKYLYDRAERDCQKLTKQLLQLMKEKNL